jgi:hypothetical protein
MSDTVATAIRPDLAGVGAVSQPCCGGRSGGPKPPLGARREIASPPGATYIERKQTPRPRRADEPTMLFACIKECTIEVATGRISSQQVDG